MSFYLKDGETLWPTQEGVYDVRANLPVGTYTVGHSIKGFYLNPITDFDIKGKIYGKTTRQADRILQTFGDRPNSTGVLLNGEKGSGKTMLAKIISQKAAQQGISTLVINTAFTGDGFNQFIQSIDEPCVIVFDEFEKVFDEKEQEATLTLLDGVYPTKKLFVLTVNDKYRVNQHMRNRPGRIFYMLDFKGLDEDFIREYCMDNLKDTSHTDQVARLHMMFDSFNFDMLKALVEEMNRYNESVNQALEMLNAAPTDGGRNVRHKVSVFMNGQKLDDKCVSPSVIRGVPVAHDSLDFWIDPNPNDDESKSFELEVTPGNLKKIEPEEGKFTYVLNEGEPNMAVLVFTREYGAAKANYNWLDAF
jgi:hypothetical protein